ncbi:BnaC09g12550D [Brassica napus]|uniref:BnaC09g12550D protein n=1 Tax=Brassica napus TaxID=3708 RepID=A0A078F4J3_BRANA|nr:BnaC09g12550D [Brassica napus]
MSHTAAVETEGSSRLRALRISLIAHAFGYEVTLTPVGSSPTANILSGSRHGGPCIPSFSSIRLLIKINYC